MQFATKSALAVWLALCVAAASGSATAQTTQRPSRPMSATSVPSGSQPYTATAMWQLKRLATPAISPDGRMAVVAVTHYNIGLNQEISNLWLVPTRAGRARQLTGGTTMDVTPAWSPDGRWIAFVSTRGDDKQPQVYLIPVDGGEARRITTIPTGATAPKWFADSRRIAFLSRVWSDIENPAGSEARLVAAETARMSGKTWDRAPIAFWDTLLDDRQLHLFWADMDGGTPHAITSGTGHALDIAHSGAEAYDISPDGLEVAFASDTDTTGRQPNLDIYVVSTAGGEAANLTADNPADDLAPRYSPDGRLLAFGRQQIRDFYADRVRLMLFDRRSRDLRDLTPTWDRSAAGIVWSPDSRSLFGTVEDAGTRRVYRFDVSGGAPVAFTAESSYTDLAVAGSGPAIVALRSSFSEPPTLVSIISRASAATKLSDFNDAALATLALGKVESVTYPGANDDAVQMWVVYPPGFTADRKWPLYLLLHGGPHDSVQNELQWRWNALVFASWGYVTAWPNFHGSSGFGQAFMDSAARDWSDLPYQDTIKAADWFAAQPWIDKERMAAGGGSYGGYLAAVLLGKAHPFKTLIAHAPVYNLFDDYAMDKGARGRRYGEHWQDRERFERNSPHLAAGNFHTPTLVIHGQQDLRVPVSQSFALFNTLQNRGVPSRLVYFPDESHWIQKPQNSLFWYDSMRRWLQQYVPPGPERAPAPPAAASAAPLP